MFHYFSKFIHSIKKKYYYYTVSKTAHSVGKRLFVGGPCCINKNTEIGDYVSFNGLSIYGNGSVKIGDEFHSGSGCTFITEFHNYNGNALPYDNTTIVKNIVIENNVWFGLNVTVLGGVTIGEGAIIQAGSVVVDNIPKCAIAGGHPAKVFKYRNKEHYEKLKKEKKFNHSITN